MRKLALSFVALLVAAVTAASPAGAITYGQPDAGEHPYVGFMIFFSPADPGWFSCSGTLLDAGTFLTAAHCTYGIGTKGQVSPGTSGGTDVWVTFQEQEVLKGWPYVMAPAGAAVAITRATAPKTASLSRLIEPSSAAGNLASGVRSPCRQPNPAQHAARVRPPGLARSPVPYSASEPGRVAMRRRRASRTERPSGVQPPPGPRQHLVREVLTHARR